jgi:hypothetical protein
MLRTDRRGHYLMISQRDPILKLNDTPYQNTEEDWTDLLNDSKDASYLDLVPAEDFVDRRNAGLPPERWGEDMELKQSEPETLWQRFSLPEEERDPWVRQHTMHRWFRSANVVDMWRYRSPEERERVRVALVRAGIMPP